MIRPGYAAPWRERMEWRMDMWADVQRLAPSEQTCALSADLEACRRDWRYWIDRWCWMYNPHARHGEGQTDDPVILWPRQVEYIEWLIAQVDDGDPESIGAVPKVRKVGVTWCSLFAAYWLAWTRPGFSAVLISRKQQYVDSLGDLDSLIEKLRYTWRWQPAHLQPKAAFPHMRFLLENGSSIVGETTSEGAAQGGRKSLVYIDEAARISARVLQSIMLSTASVGPRVLVYNPGEPGHPTHRMHMSREPSERLPDSRLMPLDWRTDPRLNLAWWEGLLIENGGSMTKAERASTYGLAYGYVQSATIWETPAVEAKWIIDLDDEAARHDFLDRMGAHILVVGMDYGFGASMTTAMSALWAPNEGGPYGTLYYVWTPSWARKAIGESAAQIRAFVNGRRGPCDIVGDPTGEAPDAEQLCVRERYNALGVPVSSLPVEANKMEAKEWAIDSLQRRFDYGTVKFLSSCEYGIEVANGWRRDLPPGVTLEDSRRGYVPPAKDRLSHGGDGMLYVEIRVAQLARARIAAQEEREVDQWAIPTRDAADIAWGGTPW